MKKRRKRKLARLALVGAIGVAAVTLAGCLRVSGGTWYFESAAVPEGWPALTPVGEVQVKEYPVSRAAVVSEVDVEGDGTESMFMTLFRHIGENGIAMTAPVDLGYEDGADGPRMVSMAFLYRRPDLGVTGRDGAVQVRDLEARTYASVGVRGDYDATSYRRGVEALEEWLDGNGAWRASGQPRYLGYNGPFVPRFARYGEVQVPVTQRAGEGTR
jgi:hypothetical protein